MSELSFSSDAREPVHRILAHVEAAYANGARTFWIANHLFQRDAVTIAQAVLTRFNGMRVVLMAVNPYTLHPVQVAMAAATLAELFPGRVSLCVGVGAPVDLASLDIESSKPLAMIREAVQVLRELFTGKSVTFTGAHFAVRDRSLANGRVDVPIILAASGPQMLELAGRIADGVLMSAGSSVEFVRWSLEHVRRGAQDRNIRIHALTFAAVDESDRSVACARMRATLAMVLRGSHHERNLQLAGSVLDQERLNTAMSAKDQTAVSTLLTDDIIQRHAVCGTPTEVRERFANYHAAGLDEIVLAGVKDEVQVAALFRSVHP